MTDVLKPALRPSGDLVDGEHHMQLQLLDALQKAVTEGRERPEIDALLERLADYTEVHFASEQLLMRLYAFPGYDAHVDEHDRTLAWLSTLRATWRGEDREVMLETARELHSWIAGHIERSDRLLARYLDGLGDGTPAS